MSNHNPLFFYLKIRHDRSIEGSPLDPLVRFNVDSRRDGDLAGQEDHQFFPDHHYGDGGEKKVAEFGHCFCA